MALPELPVEVWKRIIPLLRKDPPKPLSKPARSDLRQHDLTVLMCCCRLFHEITAPLLYEEVITDNWVKIFRLGENSPKRRQLSLIKTIKLEYRAKGNHPEPSYSDIIRIGRQPTWQKVGRSAKEQNELVMQECFAETEDLQKTLWLIEGLGGMNALFPKLEKLAVGSIYGRDEGEVWSRYEDWHIERDTNSNTHACGVSFHDLLTSSNLRSLCIRDPSGPLHIPTLSHASDRRIRTPKFSQTIHFDFSQRLDQLASPLGSPISWVSDCPPDTDLAMIFRRMYENLQELCQVRDQYRSQRHYPDTADITIYGSTKQITPRMVYHHIGPIDLGPCVAGYGPEALRRQVLTDYERRVTVKSMGEALQAEYRKQSRVKDVIRWLPSEDAAPCGTCGSLPPT